MVDMHGIISVVGVALVEFRCADAAGWQVHRHVLTFVIVKVEAALLGRVLRLAFADGSA